MLAQRWKPRPFGPRTAMPFAAKFPTVLVEAPMRWASTAPVTTGSSSDSNSDFFTTESNSKKLHRQRYRGAAPPDTHLDCRKDPRPIRKSQHQTDRSD